MRAMDAGERVRRALAAQGAVPQALRSLAPASPPEAKQRAARRSRKRQLDPPPVSNEGPALVPADSAPGNVSPEFAAWWQAWVRRKQASAALGAELERRTDARERREAVIRAAVEDELEPKCSACRRRRDSDYGLYGTTSDHMCTTHTAGYERAVKLMRGVAFDRGL